MIDKIKVKIRGCATVSIDTVVSMTLKDYEELRLELDDKANCADAMHCILFDFAGLPQGNFDDLELETFERTIS